MTAGALVLVTAIAGTGWSGRAAALEPYSVDSAGSIFSASAPFGYHVELGPIPDDPFRDASSPYMVAQPEPVAPFPILLNRAVKHYVNDFLRQPDLLEDTLERSQPFLQDMVRELRRHGVPDDLVYLAFAESLFSKDGRGPWQFNADTARRYGLKVDYFLDERRDPILSTRAAAECLADLHDAAGYDWRLAVVGWNAGETAIDRYWSLRGANFSKFASRLPKRTRTLLGRFMAVAFIAQNPTTYGINPVRYDDPPAYREITVPGGAALSHIATLNNTTTTRLHELNPALLQDHVPYYERQYSLRVPAVSAAASF